MLFYITVKHGSWQLHSPTLRPENLVVYSEPVLNSSFVTRLVQNIVEWFQYLN